MSLWAVLYLIAAYWAATALFYILSRFRAPILPLVAAAAGGWASWMIRAWRRKPRERRRTLLLGGGAVLQRLGDGSSFAAGELVFIP